MSSDLPLVTAPGPNGEHLPGPVNEQLATYLGALTEVADKPWFLQEEIAAALPEDGRQADLVIDKPSDPDGTYLDSWDILLQTKEVTDDFVDGYRRPLIIAQAHHVGRVAAQAHKIGYDPIVPPGLTDAFDPDPAQGQGWIKSRGRWLRREIPAIYYLKWIEGKL